MRKMTIVLAAALVAMGGSVPAALPASAAVAACPVRATKYGTTASETIEGTSGNDVICAGAGNDTIIGNGGIDKVYGGPGNDRIVTGGGRDTVFGGSGSDTVDTGAGDDLVFGDNPATGLRDRTDTGVDGPDVIFSGTGGDSVDGGGGNDVINSGGIGSKSIASANVVHGGTGNDVIMSDFRYPGGFEWFYGDAGSDFLYPNPIRLNPLGNLAVGGAGNDVILLLNGLPDGAHQGDVGTSVKFPLGKLCSVTVPLPDDPAPGDTGKLTCALPVAIKIPGLIDGVTLSTSINANGKATTTVSVKPGPALAGVQALQQMAKGNFPSEQCLCDPKLPGWASMLGDTVYR